MSCLSVVTGCPHLLVVEVCFALFVVDCLDVLCFEIVKLYAAKTFTRTHGAVVYRSSFSLTAVLRHWKWSKQLPLCCQFPVPQHGC